MSHVYNQSMNLITLVRLAKPRAVQLVALLLLAFSAGAASQSQPQSSAPPVPDTLQQRLAACTTCHGVHGEGTPGSKFFPRLAGKPAAYLARQLQDFQSGLRKYGPMEYTVRHLSPAYMQEIAEYFSAQDVPYTLSPVPPVSAATLQRGEQLVTRGDASLKIPACSSCHGRELTGVEPSIPGLVGLPYDYISSQLGSWRTHTRATVAPDCMALVASRLRESDITAVAAWLASHEVAPGARPQAAGTIKPQLRCGVLGPTEKDA